MCSDEGEERIEALLDFVGDSLQLNRSAGVDAGLSPDTGHALSNLTVHGVQIPRRKTTQKDHSGNLIVPA